MNENTINWFEIPATNFDQAVDFYSAILNIAIRKEVFAGLPHGIFRSSKEGGVGGAIVKGNGDPLTGGVLIFLNADSSENLKAILARIPAQGGQILQPYTEITPQGAIAVFKDIEGNRVGLHAPPQE